MHKLLPLLLFTLLFTTTSAQITVTQGNFPRQASFTDTILSSNQPGIQFPTEGAAQVWDYSSLATSNTEFRTHSDATADPVFTNSLNSYQTDLSFLAFTVPATRYEAIDGNGWFLKGQAISEVNYPLIGITGNPFDSIGFTSRNDIFSGRINPVRFPCTFLTQWSGTQVERIDFRLTIPGAGLNQEAGYRTRSVTDTRDVVGYGKLLIPSQGGGPTDSMNVIQIKVFREITDSIFLSGSPAPGPVLNSLGLTQGAVVRDTLYVFFRAGYSGIVLNLNVSGGNVNLAKYRPQADNVVTTSLADKKLVDMNYYPNPVKAGEQMTIAMPSGFTEANQLAIHDMLGRQVYGSLIANSSPNFRFEIPENTRPGIYILQILDSAGRAVSVSRLQVN